MLDDIKRKTKLKCMAHKTSLCVLNTYTKCFLAKSIICASEKLQGQRILQKRLYGDLQDQTPLLSDLACHVLHTASSGTLIASSQFHQSWIHDLPSKNSGAPGDTCKPSPPLVPVATCRYTQIGVPSPTRQGRRRSGAATTDHGSEPRGQVPNLREPDLGLYKWKPDLQEA